MRSVDSWLSRFCYRHPRLGIPNLMRYVVFANVIVFVMDMFSSGTFSALLAFHPARVLHGQVWRLITFVFVPLYSGMRYIFFFALSLYFYYFIGTALEREWGYNKFTIFYVFGVILNIIVGFVIGTASMYFVNMSMFFAFATLYPDLQFLLFLIIPVKAKWLAWLDAAYFAYLILSYLFTGNFLLALLPIVAVLNYLIFFASDVSYAISNLQRRAGYQRNTRKKRDPKIISFNDAKGKNYLHKCAVCGKTDVTDPQMEFRYCSRCNGYYCYCADHINSHIHIE